MKTPSAGSRSEAPLRLLCFGLGLLELAVELDRVREIIRFTAPAWMPGYATAVQGVVDVRGDAVVVVDLATALGMQASRLSSESCILVVEAGQSAQPGAVVGLVVDAARRIVETDPGTLRAAPRNRDGEPAGHWIAGVTRDEPPVRVIDLDRLLAGNAQLRGPAGRATGDATDEASRAGEEALQRARASEEAADPDGAKAPGLVDSRSGRGAGAHLVFAVAGHRIALPAMRVDHVVQAVHLKPVPKSPAELDGILLLDRIVGVLDVAALFGLATRAASAESGVLVVGEPGGGGGLAFGLRVDEVSDVVEVADGDLVPSPRAGGLRTADWTAGMLRADERFVPVLDLARVLDSDPVRAAARAARAALETSPEQRVGSGPASPPKPRRSRRGASAAKRGPRRPVTR